MAKKAAVIKGDGIGPEVVDSMLHVLKECNTQMEIINCEAGSEQWEKNNSKDCLLYTSPSPRDYAASRMPSSA